MAQSTRLKCKEAVKRINSNLDKIRGDIIFIGEQLQFQHKDVAALLVSGYESTTLLQECLVEPLRKMF